MFEGGREGGEQTAEEGEVGGATTKEMARRPRWVVEKRMRNVPGGGGGNRVISDKMVKRCNQMLKDLRDRGSHSLNWFLNPVTEAEAPGYFTIIEKPMDLRKVDNNLRDKAYRDLHEFAADLRLVFTNAMRFNASESSVYIDAQKSLNIFNDIYKRACSELKTGYHDDASSGLFNDVASFTHFYPDVPKERALQALQQERAADADAPAVTAVSAAEADAVARAACGQV
eukprot:evm.model.NODE_7006_length_6284_cov_39.080044.3